jgi:acylphosphatase
MPEGRGAGAPSISERLTRRFLITGKVQGVYFRHSARLEAERLGVVGVARNLPDGSVEVVAHGTREAVESLREWLQRGPSGARVAGVQELEPLADQDVHSTRSFRAE